jgi:raffinose/stachyose/melibiose transport system substrate-binding protein
MRANAAPDRLVRAVRGGTVKHTKRALAGTATMAAILLLAAGCATSGSSSSTASAQANAPVTLTFATNLIGAQPTGTSPVTKSLIAQFEKKYPNVTIQLEESQATALQPVIQLAFSSNKVPDVFNFWRPQPAFNMDKYIASGELGDLSSLAKTPSIHNEFPATSWATATVGGKTWGLPLENFAVPLIVNKAVFTKAGLPLPTTWAKLKSDVPALKAKGIIPWTLSTQPVQQSDDRLLDYVLNGELGNAKALALFQGKGSFTSAAVEKALGDYVSISNNDGPSDAAALDDNSAIAKYFNTGQSAMLIDNSGYLPAIDKSVASDMEVIPFPTIPGGAETTPHIEKDLTTLMYASKAGLADKAKGPAIRNFLAFMTSPNAQKMFAQQSVLVPANGVAPDPAKTGQLFASVQKATSTLPGDKWLGNGRTPSQEQTFYPLMSQAWAGTFTAKQFAQQLQTMFN